jgi:hypothetical protein
VATALRIRPDLSRARVLFLSLFLAFAQWIGADSGRIGDIEFFGYKGWMYKRFVLAFPFIQEILMPRASSPACAKLFSP